MRSSRIFESTRPVAAPRLVLAAMLSVVMLAAAVGQALLDEYRLVPSTAVKVLASGPANPGADALMAAAILFSGVDPARASQAADAGRRRIAEAVSLARTVRGDESIGNAQAREYELGRRILALVHSFLVRYDEFESRIDRALLEGRYNCVSSSTLYVILATAAGLDAGGMILPDHVYCFLPLADRRIDVETTSANGYDNGAAKRPATGLAWSVGGSARGTEMSARGIVALVLRNRATLAERGGQWATALGFAVDAYAYVAGTAAEESSRETLEGRVNNCVSALLESRRWADAVALADEAIAAYGQSDGFAALRKVASLAYLTEALRNAAGQEALALADEAAAAGEADAAWLDRAYAWAYGSLADERRKAGDHLGAWKTAAEGAARFPASGELARLELAARSNWVKDSHNRFAASYNAGDYAQALALIESALTVAPGEHVLVEDERVARAALGHLPGVVSP